MKVTWVSAFFRDSIPPEDLRPHFTLICLRSQEEEIKKGKADCFEKQLIALKDSIGVQLFQAPLPKIRTGNYQHQVGRTTRKQIVSACVPSHLWRGIKQAICAPERTRLD